MPSIYGFKPAFQRMLRPGVDALARAGATANWVTMAAMLLSMATGATFAFVASPKILLLLPVVLSARMALNAIDGMLAREHGQASRLGAVLNELGDVVSDAALYLPLALRPGFPPVAVVALAVLAVIVEMTGVVGVQIGASRRYEGPLGKSDRAFVFGALGLVLGLGFAPRRWLEIVLWLLVVLSFVTIVNRVRAALAEVRS